MRDAMASPNREPEKRPAETLPQAVPLDAAADVMSQFEVESPESDGADLFPVEGSEPPRIAAFPTAPHATLSVATPVASAPPKWRNGRNAILALLALVVLTQGALMAYWMLSSGGLAAVTRTTGNVSITSEPAGSTVSIDGAVRGLSLIHI